jgi:hypothetical protein
MGEYFKPWRRKIGVVTLVMGLACLGGWARSFSVFDSVALPLPYSGNYGFVLISTNGRVWCGRIWCEEPIIPNWDASSLPLLRATILPSGESVEQTFIALYRDDLIPYSSIVVPLTLLSAWLLLSKPLSAKSGPTHVEDSPERSS